MAFRKAALEALGGFDLTYTKAGDDVDICWRLQANGGHLAFSPAALVWHQHRNSARAYWRRPRIARFLNRSSITASGAFRGFR